MSHSTGKEQTIQKQSTWLALNNSGTNDYTILNNDYGFFSIIY